MIDDSMTEAAAVRKPKTKFDALFALAKPRGFFLMQIEPEVFALERKHVRRFTGNYFECRKWLERLDVLD
jgi:hypothetical protein